MLPKKKQSIGDDYETRNRTVRAPEMCVDYLSYRFDEMDLAASWRVMTKQKKDIVNGLRLENASWRTWAKHKYRLSTVSPETLNWLKDSDVTWLYGPLHTVIKNIEEKDRYAKPKIATTEDTLGLMTTNHRRPGQPLKSVLKKVTASDLLRRSASELQANQINDDQEEQYPHPHPQPQPKAQPQQQQQQHQQQHQHQHQQPQQQSSKPSLSLTEANKKLKAFSPSVIATHRQPKLRFNQHVEQCVALSDTEDRKRHRPRARFSNILDEDEDEEEDEEEGYSDDENAIVLDYDNQPRSSIKKIAPARLKTSSQSEQETDEVSSLSSSSASSMTGGNNYSWMVGQDTFDENVHTTSDEEDEDDDDDQLEIRRRAHYIPSSGSSASSSDAIQWVGQSCVYNVQEPSDYDDDYGFDDDDWTHDENEMPSPPLPPAAPIPASPPPASPAAPLPCHPRGQQFPGKAVAVSEPSPVEADEPSITRVSSYHKVTDIHHAHGESSSSSNSSDSNPTILGHIAQWASSYLWPRQPPSSSPNK
ncbi:hypothetical protein BDB00DRAFT_930085 [Zychaea mexicana]|uniref:uncharacterized protein n=1 Tax=Zychaea mexicana TaxID=64656 RepID=UPI0022FE2107|nr:uncharacterized protein BDB00DRAFT_930085 [Zychaea mexicana]KAI9492023.1 hypothetical protein BDB00DRAFT_930085 [Zychaea mexicana]